MREIVEKLCRIENELEKRRSADRLARYNVGEKKHEKQLAFHKCPKRNRWVFGGNRSGKTECGAVECIYISRGFTPIEKQTKYRRMGRLPLRSGAAGRRAKENSLLPPPRLD